MSLVIVGATVMDGVANEPLSCSSIWIEGSTIKAVGSDGELGAPPGARVIQAQGKYIIPGLMNANVHLLMDIRPENLVRHLGHFEDLIAEAAQVALKNGVTTVFDTWGPRRALMAVRDAIAAGETEGSRVFCAGNIIGLDGPFSPDFDFLARGGEGVSTAFARQINAMWVENVGRQLMWQLPEEAARQVGAYIENGIDFIKYASNDHVPGAFLAFSPRAQSLMVEEAHRAGLTAQAHTMSVEGLRIAVEAGCDLIQHVNITGPVPIPENTLAELAARRTGTVVFPQTQRRLESLMKNESYKAYRGPKEWEVSDLNVRSLIRCGAPLLLGTDGAIVAPEALSNPVVASGWKQEPEGNLFDLASGHIFWFRAMEEKGCPPMEMLRAATCNVAAAYGKSNDLGTLEPGKIADLLILDKNPLDGVENYRSISMIIKDGAIVDRDALPRKPVLTKPSAPAPEEAVYVPFLSSATFPPCLACRRG